jgi:hypothetical protein
MKKILLSFSSLALISLPLAITSCSKEQSKVAKIKDNLQCSADGTLMYKDTGKDVDDENIKKDFHCHGNEVHEAAAHHEH